MRAVLKAVLLALVLFCLPSTAVGQDLFAGYDAFCGVRVVVGSTDRGALALRDAQGPLIYIDRGMFANWTGSRLFTLAHECAHHKLGHSTPTGMQQRMTPWGTRQQELAADCWAARVLTRLGYAFDVERTLREQARHGHRSAGGYPSGVERAQNVARCRAAATRATSRPDRFVSLQEGASSSTSTAPSTGAQAVARTSVEPLLLGLPAEEERIIAIADVDAETLAHLKTTGWTPTHVFWAQGRWNAILEHGPAGMADVDWTWTGDVPGPWINERTKGEDGWFIQSIDRAPDGEWAVVLGRLRNTTDQDWPPFWSYTYGDTKRDVLDAMAGSGYVIRHLFEIGDPYAFVAFAEQADGTGSTDFIRAPSPTAALNWGQENGRTLVSMHRLADGQHGFVLRRTDSRTPPSQRLAVYTDMPNLARDVAENRDRGYTLMTVTEMGDLIYALYREDR